MKKIYTFLVSFFLLLPVFGQKENPQQVDSTVIKIQQIQLLLNKLSTINDSLNRELVVLKSQENIVLNRLNQVEAHSDVLFGGLITFFTFLQTFILGVAGLLGWRFYKNEINLIKTESIRNKNNIENLISSSEEKIRKLSYWFYLQTSQSIHNSFLSKLNIHSSYPELFLFNDTLTVFIFKYKVYQASLEEEKEESIRALDASLINTLTAGNSYLKFLEGLSEKERESHLTIFTNFVKTDFQPFITSSIKIGDTSLASRSLQLKVILEKIADYKKDRQ